MSDYDIENHMVLGNDDYFYGSRRESVELIDVCSGCDCAVYDDMEYKYIDSDCFCAECAEKEESDCDN